MAGVEGVEAVEKEDDGPDPVWGPLKGPVKVKIADLGNACWVVSAL